MTTIGKHISTFIACLLCSLSVNAQSMQPSKMSSWVRSIVAEQQMKPLSRTSAGEDRDMLTALIRTRGDVSGVLPRYGGRCLMRFGDISIVSLPVGSIAAMSADSRVLRIEARPSVKIQMDSVCRQVGAMSVWQGLALPQAYTGRGVLVGVEDIGFDLTHPNFYSRDMKRYRIRQLWDQLSADSAGSGLYVGAEYKGRESLLAYAHSRDGEDHTHGTNTAGMAAGSGYDTDYRGIAWESDLCLVANCANDDAKFIAPQDRYKFTFATDIMGFKYIFDVADSLGMPCVVNFSEGEVEDLRGDDQLAYAVIDSMLGPGHILVSSAGNNSTSRTYIHKPVGEYSAGTFLVASSLACVTAQSAEPFDIRYVVYGSRNDTICLRIDHPLDSIYTDTLRVDSMVYAFTFQTFRNCYDSTRYCVDAYVQSNHSFGSGRGVSFEVVGNEADIEAYSTLGQWTGNKLNYSLRDGERTHNVNTPSSAPRVISVGATGYRTGFYNYLGQWREYESGVNGLRSHYSSVGPSWDGRLKPEVMAPGTNVISSYSSYYIEHHPDASDILSDVAHFEYNGRTYAWNCNTGTSMSSPVVAGVIALWLQACPTLTPEDVLDVIAHTSTRPDASLSYPNNQYGYGQIDAYHGLLYLLGLDGIDGISSHQADGVTVRPASGGKIIIQLDSPASSSIDVSVYNLSGVKVAAATMPAGESQFVFTPSLGKGVYAVQLGHKGSTLVRIDTK